MEEQQHQSEVGTEGLPVRAKPASFSRKKRNDKECECESTVPTPSEPKELQGGGMMIHCTECLQVLKHWNQGTVKEAKAPAVKKEKQQLGLEETGIYVIDMVMAHKDSDKVVLRLIDSGVFFTVIVTSQADKVKKILNNNPDLVGRSVEIVFNGRGKNGKVVNPVYSKLITIK